MQSNREKKQDMLYLCIREDTDWEQRRVGDGTATKGGNLWASTLLLHQYALGVQTEGMEGSLCWCAITHKVLFLRSLVITKTFRLVFSLFISQFMNEPISAESYGPDGDAITATISSGSFNFTKALCYDNRVSCKCQPILERINSSGGKLSFVTA